MNRVKAPEERHSVKRSMYPVATQVGQNYDFQELQPPWLASDSALNGESIIQRKRIAAGAIVTSVSICTPMWLVRK
jgi:hypothetical protein